jgi:hypothetical protein
MTAGFVRKDIGREGIKEMKSKNTLQVPLKKLPKSDTQSLKRHSGQMDKFAAGRQT